MTVAAAADTIVLSYNDFDELRSLFERIGGQIAAVITEAAPANMGVVTPAEGFNAEIRRLTAEHGALMILDEVLTGFRVGASGWWGFEAGVEAPEWAPDLITFGKVVGGGMPLAAVGGRREIMDLLAPLGPSTRRARSPGIPSPPRPGSPPSTWRNRRSMTGSMPAPPSCSDWSATR